MQNFAKKCAFLAVLFLLMASYPLHAAKSAYQPSIPVQTVVYSSVPSTKRNLFVHGYCKAYHIPTDLCFFIRCLLYDNPFRYRNKPLPDDLSEQDLSGFDFTGCHFTHTNLTDSNLEGGMLTNTTCDYQKAFEENSKKNQLDWNDWYQENLPKDLKSIAQVYPKLNNHVHKAKLLAVAADLAWLPFYESTEFHIKVQYWSCELLQLKQVLGTLYGNKLICSLEWYLNDDAEDYCWTTEYPQNKVNINTPAPHANFDTYLKDFTSGLNKYQCKSEDSRGFNWYKDQITKNIEGLAATYPHIKEKKLQQEALDIAHALSKSYQIQKGAFLNHYLFFQHQLIRLKKSVSVGVKNKVYYNAVSSSRTRSLGWRRGKK